MSKKPKPESIPPSRRIPTQAQGRPPVKRWVFSFRFWRQIPYFELGDRDPKWFASLLEKLTELSKESIETFRGDQEKKDAWRYHDIDWNQQNIPVRRSDFDWIDRDYIEDDADYPFLQFQISKGLGRVIGFWDETDVFHIVLLDPLHNMQPAKSFGYKVSATSPLRSEYVVLLGNVEEARKKRCDAPACPAFEALRSLPGNDHYYNVVILRLDDDLHSKVKDALKHQRVGSYEEILDWGLLNIDEDSSQAGG